MLLLDLNKFKTFNMVIDSVDIPLSPTCYSATWPKMPPIAAIALTIDEELREIYT